MGFTGGVADTLRRRTIDGEGRAGTKATAVAELVFIIVFPLTSVKKHALDQCG